MQGNINEYIIDNSFISVCLPTVVGRSVVVVGFSVVWRGRGVVVVVLGTGLHTIISPDPEQEHGYGHYKIMTLLFNHN